MCQFLISHQQVQSSIFHSLMFQNLTHQDNQIHEQSPKKVT